MAGLFGYEKDHYEVSMRMGERRLFPTVRGASSRERVVVAPGTSCREQISGGTGRHAVHPAEYLASRLDRALLGIEGLNLNAPGRGASIALRAANRGSCRLKRSRTEEDLSRGRLSFPTNWPCSRTRRATRGWASR
jgi:hypothetical protein